MNAIVSFFSTVFDFIRDLVCDLGVDPNSGLSYVLAVTVLTIIIRGILLPFNIKSSKSSQKMQEIQPEVQKIQEKYKNDPQKAQLELMNLYKEKNVSMTGGCLLPLIPFPILMALYWTFNKIDISGGFLWIPDLGKPDPYYILPILSAVMTFIPSYLLNKASAPAKTKEGTNQQQPMNMMTMNVMMSLMMGWMALKFKSLLVIYWVLGGVIQLITTYFINYRPAVAKRKAVEAEEAEKEAEKNKFKMPVYESTNSASKKKKKKK